MAFARHICRYLSHEADKDPLSMYQDKSSPCLTSSRVLGLQYRSTNARMEVAMHNHPPRSEETSSASYHVSKLLAFPIATATLGPGSSKSFL